MLNFHCKFLNSQNEELIDQNIWLLTNIICENKDFRNIIFKTPIIDKICSIIYHYLNYNQTNLIKSSSNFLFYSLNHNSLSKDLNESIGKILPVIIRLILNTSGEIFSNSLWALMHLTSAEDKEYILTLLTSLLMQNNGEVLIKIFSLDFDNHKTELVSAIRIIGNLFSLDNEQFIYNLLDFGIFDFFDKILSTEKNKKIKHEILYAISNIISQNFKSQMKQLVESNLYNRILNICNEFDLKLKKDAIILIYNICTITYFNLSTELVKKGTFRMIIELCENTNDHEIILYSLYSIDKIIASGEFLKSVLKDNTIAKKFEACGGCDCLERFQSNPNIEIYHKSMEILEKYFESYSDHMLLCNDESKIKKTSNNMEGCDSYREFGNYNYKDNNQSNFYEMN